MTDTDFMPYGKYKKRRMIDIPAAYFFWLLESDNCNEEVMVYILDNKDVLQKEYNKEMRIKNQSRKY